MAEMDRRRFFGVTGAAAATSALALQHDEASTPVNPAEQSEHGTPENAIVVSAVSEVTSLDPALAVDTETERVCRQVFETLVGIEQETGSTAPLLAAGWEISDDQLTYTFELQEGVTFQDGSELTADVIVANFERWGRLDEIYGDEVLDTTVPLAFASVFGGFMGDEDCVLESVEADDEHTVVLTLTEPVVFLIQALTLPAFGIVSAETLSDDDPEQVSENPVGTGAYQVISTEGGQIVLRAFEDHWNGAAQVEQVTVRSIPRSFDRLRELQRGQLDVYDYVTADNLRTLVQSGRMFLQRDPFSVLYLGFNLEHPVMSDPLVREAVARAVNRGSLVQNHFLEGTSTAHQFTPAALGVHSEEAPRFSMNRDEAERLLEESGYDGEELPFYYPMNATRSYLPQPEAIFASIARDLTRVGMNVVPRPVPWNDSYVDSLLADEDRAMHLLGRNGGYRSPHSFLGPLFSSVTSEFNYDNEEVRDLIHQARSETQEDSRNDLYREAAELIAEDIPALPLAYPISGLALGQNIVDYPFSPVLHELFRDIVPQ